MRVFEVSMEWHRDERAGGNGRYRRKPADQWHSPARFPRAKVRAGRRLNPVHLASTRRLPTQQAKADGVVSLLPTTVNLSDDGNHRLNLQLFLPSISAAYRVLLVRMRLYGTLHVSPDYYGRFITDFQKWESYRMMPLVGRFSRGSPVSPVLPFKRCSILTSLHPHRLPRPRCERFLIRWVASRQVRLPLADWVTTLHGQYRHSIGACGWSLLSERPFTVPDCAADSRVLAVRKTSGADNVRDKMEGNGNSPRCSKAIHSREREIIKTRTHDVPWFAFTNVFRPLRIRPVRDDFWSAIDLSVLDTPQDKTSELARPETAGYNSTMPCPRSSGVGWPTCSRRVAGSRPGASDVADAQLDCRTGNSLTINVGSRKMVPPTAVSNGIEVSFGPNFPLVRDGVDAKQLVSGALFQMRTFMARLNAALQSIRGGGISSKWNLSRASEKLELAMSGLYARGVVFLEDEELSQGYTIVYPFADLQSEAVERTLPWRPTAYCSCVKCSLLVGGCSCNSRHWRRFLALETNELRCHLLMNADQGDSRHNVWHGLTQAGLSSPFPPAQVHALPGLTAPVNRVARPLTSHQGDTGSILGGVTSVFACGNRAGMMPHEGGLSRGSPMSSVLTFPVLLHAYLIHTSSVAKKAVATHEREINQYYSSMQCGVREKGRDGDGMLGITQAHQRFACQNAFRSFDSAFQTTSVPREQSGFDSRCGYRRFWGLANVANVANVALRQRNAGEVCKIFYALNPQQHTSPCWGRWSEPEDKGTEMRQTCQLLLPFLQDNLRFTVSCNCESSERWHTKRVRTSRALTPCRVTLRPWSPPLRTPPAWKFFVCSRPRSTKEIRAALPSARNGVSLHSWVSGFASTTGSSWMSHRALLTYDRGGFWRRGKA
ncbi:hypothetical protein PR048_013786 [Dryococelus australis]|uniref:Uncharacterized protein n=1 Tax=Dryococelus australis TaxID=614101 RepID=A0ABQ9HTF8_9NEOP|nr:hypothetical protein PR048_013786 [Dryococelus australis]